MLAVFSLRISFGLQGIKVEGLKVLGLLDLFFRAVLGL